LPGHPVENVTLQNIRLSFKGGGPAELATLDVPENETKYPEYRMFGVLPAYGFYCRHVNNLKLLNVELGFEKTDYRPAVIGDDLTNVEFFDVSAQSTSRSKSMIWLNNVKNAFIHGSRPDETVNTFLYLSGAETQNISLINNDFSRISKTVQRDKEVSKKALFVSGNRKK